MKINEKQLRGIIRESLQAILNEYRHYPMIPFARENFYIEEFESYILEHATQEEISTLMNRYGQQNDDEEYALMRAVDTLPSELTEYPGMEITAKYNGDSIEVDEEAKKQIEYIISSINDDILKKFAISYFNDWINNIDWDFRDELDPDYDPDSDVGGYDYDR